MERQLVPVANVRVRLIVLGVLLIPVLVSYRIGVVWQLLSCILPVMLTGTYRVSRVKGDRFDTQLFMGFVPLRRQQCKLPAVVAVLTIYQEGQGWGTLILFGPVQWLMGHVFDYLLPVIGVPYEIWLETAKGRQILAWNGYNQQQYEQNLELLRVRTGAEVRLR
jgi:hypothetical protein